MSQHLDNSASATGGFTTKATDKDPYIYQLGFGNRFCSEAIPGTIPHAQNNPQKAKYGLYAEQITGSAFVAPRSDNHNAWLYRIRPTVAHMGFKSLPKNPDIESNFFPINPRVQTNPAQLTWAPFQIPSSATDFVDGIKTLAGNGDPTLREGLAIHVYTANSSMGKKAFVNVDGEMLIVPNQGRLDIQTEFGKMMVRPGEIVVIPRGIRFKVLLPDGPSRGYIQEVFGARYELPERGVIGANGLANSRDFESPVASFDIDQTAWDVIYKVSGSFHLSRQEHTPFDVVAWHGNYIPYKYALEKFINLGSLTKDHMDPSIWTVLTVKSKIPGTPLADFAIFSERWDVAYDTFRPPYYHRNAATELVGMIYGEAPGLVNEQFGPGGVHYYTGFSPHGQPYQAYYGASEAPLAPQFILKDTILIMFESSMTFSLTDWAVNRAGKVYEHETEQWAGLRPNFVDNLDEVNADLRALGRKELKAT